MAIGTLYFGSFDFDFNKEDRIFLTRKNLKKVLTSTDVKDYQSSVTDLELKTDNIRELFDHIQSIRFYDIEGFFDLEKNKNYSILNICGFLAREYKHLCKPEDYNLIFRCWVKLSFTETRVVKKLSNKAIWVAGCSWSSAYGVNSDERWGHLVAKKLELEEVNLAQPGGSIWDSSDQIIRSDMQKGDIIIWGLTSLNRVELIVNGLLGSYPPMMALRHPIAHEYFKIDYFNSDTLKYLAIRQIYQVIAHCNKIGIELYLVNFLDQTWIPEILSERKNFLDLSEDVSNLLDYGTDGQHPGPLQHQKYAKRIIKFIQGT